MQQENLSSEELSRYYHHIQIPNIGAAGQARIRNSSVLIVGVGGLGSVSSILLTRAGVGRIGIIDKDVVNASDLQRQMLYSTQDVGKRKVLVAKGRLNEINPDVEIETYDGAFDDENAEQIVKQYAMVVDGSDNLQTRELINRECVRFGIPYIYGAVDRFDGQVSVFWKGRGPCFSCLFPAENIHRDTGETPAIHVFSPLVLTVGALQANEALKIMAGIGKPLIGELLIVNTLEMRFEKIKVKQKEGCPVCGS